MNFITKFKSTLSFINFSKKRFATTSNKNKKNLVLIEFNSIIDNYISYAYFISYLTKKFNAKIVSYNEIKIKNFYNFFLYLLMKLNPFNKFKMYKSFGVDTIIYFNPNKKTLKPIIEKKYRSLIKNLKSKREFEKLKINNVLVGDLFYDTYLKKFMKPTVDFKNDDFKNFLYEEISKFYFWYDFIDNNVKSIVVSHTVYSLAIPLRICIKKNIDSYQVTWDSFFKLKKNKYMAYNNFEFYPKIFSKLTNKEKNEGLNKAKERLNLRFKGRVGIDMPYSNISSYKKINKERLIKKNNKIKILIATHCFFDSPHSYGYNLFPDHYEWLNFLGKLSKKTNYDWYIKTHPDYRPGNLEIIKDLIKKYPKLNLLPASSSHHQLIKEGISVVTTVYGSIGCEYPILNKLVVNASINNPHKAYDFNRHCKSVKDYENTIKKLPGLIKKFPINKKKVYEHYYMHKLHKYENIFEDNLIKFKDKKLEYLNLQKCLNKINNNKTLELDIKSKIEKFVKSKNYCSRF